MAIEANKTAPAIDTRPQTGLFGAGPFNLPNLITMARLALTLVLFAMISWEQVGLGIPAAVIFLLAAGTDFLDGYIARKYKLVTVLGRILDPFADKVIICGSFIFLLQRYPASGVNAWMTFIVFGREMFVTVIRSFLEERGKDFSAAWSGKIKMVLQCAAIMVSLLSFSPLLASVGFNLFRDVLLWATACFTLYTGVTYAIRARAMLRE